MIKSHAINQSVVKDKRWIDKANAYLVDPTKSSHKIITHVSSNNVITTKKFKKMVLANIYPKVVTMQIKHQPFSLVNPIGTPTCTQTCYNMIKHVSRKMPIIQISLLDFRNRHAIRDLVKISLAT